MQVDISLKQATRGTNYSHSMQDRLKFNANLVVKLGKVFVQNKVYTSQITNLKFHVRKTNERKLYKTFG